jgi:hypothetical protein
MLDIYHACFLRASAVLLLSSQQHCSVQMCTCVASIRVLAHPQVQLLHFCEEAPNRVITLAVMQQQEPRVAGSDVRCHKEVVETVHCLQWWQGNMSAGTCQLLAGTSWQCDSTRHKKGFCPGAAAFDIRRYQKTLISSTYGER